MEKVKQVRLEKKISLYRISKETGITYSALFKIEQGGDVKLSTLRKIAAAMNCKISDIVE